jgi:hypothetical protein
VLDHFRAGNGPVCLLRLGKLPKLWKRRAGFGGVSLGAVEVVFVVKFQFCNVTLGHGASPAFKSLYGDGAENAP